MEIFINKMSDHVEELTSSWSAEMMQMKEYELRNWMNARSKHFVTDFFDDRDNRISYVKRLYNSRVVCFYQILLEVANVPKIVEIIKCKRSIVSFGCGPGPEVAAYIAFVRDFLGCKYNILDITAVDCLAQWGSFFNAIRGLDHYANIKFKAGRLSNEYLSKMEHSDVCIMSYPHAMNFEDIWENLKKKFSLIIFIDQAKHELLNLARFHNFEIVDFLCKGPKKFFYHIDENYDHREKTLRKCSNLLHEMDYLDNICRSLVEKLLPCGHIKTIYCNQYHMTDLKILCTERVIVPCYRNLHNTYANCGSKEKCQGVVSIPRECGHSVKVRCSETSIERQPCMESTTKVCKRGIHTTNLPCSLKFICYEKVLILEKCGHSYPIKCSETAVVKKDKRIAEHTCQRQLHRVLSECGSKVLCEQFVKVKKKCGHLVTIKCSEDERSRVCSVKMRKTCPRGLHKKMVACLDLLICEEIIECKLACGHNAAIKCCERESSIQCRYLVTMKCRRNLHKVKKECHEGDRCDVKCSLKLICGCRKIVKCSDFKNEGEKTICKDDCMVKAAQLYWKTLSGGREEASEEHKCHFPYNLECRRPCNKVLRCGHKCMWRCYLCLNGRLHRPCLEMCSKTLDCGHACSDYCHLGKCENCSQDCWISKLKNIFQLEKKISKENQHRWRLTLTSRSDGLFEDFKNVFEKILFDTSFSEFTEKVLEKYEFSWKPTQQLLNYYEIIAADRFPEVLAPYIKSIKLSLLAMVQWIHTRLDTLLSSHMDDFLKEFERMKTLIKICCVVRPYVEEGFLEFFIDVAHILRKLLNQDCTEVGLLHYIPLISAATGKYRL